MGRGGGKNPGPSWLSAGPPLTMVTLWGWIGSGTYNKNDVLILLRGI